MYKEHEVFISPENEDAKIWRYTDFTKFISMIDTSTLFFTRADKFKDPFEGSYPKINVAARQNVPEEIPEGARKGYLKAIEKMSETMQYWPRFHALNCWHLNEHESAAMWNLYLKSDGGIAIQSTYRRLKECFLDEEHSVFVGKVKYIDYEKERIEEGNILSPFVHKRKSFEHEKELRAVVMKWPTSDKGIDFTKNTMKDGLSIKVDLDVLIEKVYVAPNSPIWYTQLMKSVVNKYDYDFPVVRSEIDIEPVF